MLRTSVITAVRCSATQTTRSIQVVSLRATRRPYSSTINDNDPVTLEAEKQKNLRNEQHGTSTPHSHAPGWNEHLASTSEAYTKADQSNMPISEMQSHTVDYVNKRHPKTVTETVINIAESVKDAAVEAAVDAKETIMGPLATAGKKMTDAGSTGGETGTSKKGKKQK